MPSLIGEIFGITLGEKWLNILFVASLMNYFWVKYKGQEFRWNGLRVLVNVPSRSMVSFELLLDRPAEPEYVVRDVTLYALDQVIDGFAAFTPH